MEYEVEKLAGRLQSGSCHPRQLTRSADKGWRPWPGLYDMNTTSEA